MKFDIGVLGVDILVVGIKNECWVFMIGIFMVCFYVSGIGVLIKVLYFIWSLVVIKLVMMIFVFIVDNICNIIMFEEFGEIGMFFDFGVGLMCFERVNDLGLIYDMGMIDYLNFLCVF